MNTRVRLEWQLRADGLYGRDLTAGGPWSRAGDFLPADNRDVVAIHALLPGEEASRRIREAGGGVLRIQEGSGAEAVPWELAHDGIGFLAEESYVAWERQPPEVTLAAQLVVGRPLSILLLWEPARRWEEEGELAAACMAGALGGHLAAGRVMVRESVSPEETETLLHTRRWDLFCCIGGALAGPHLFDRATLLLREVATPPPLVVFHDVAVDVGDAAAAAARQGVQAGAVQGVSLRGVVAGSALLNFWRGFFQGLLVDWPGDMTRAVVAGRLALVEDNADWRGLLTFSRLSPMVAAVVDRIHLLPLRDPRFYHVGERLRGMNGREIFRHRLWETVEAAFLAGHRLVGLAGPAGSGKSLMAQLLMERLPRHPELSHEGRRVVWLNAGSVAGVSALWQQLVVLFSASGFHADPAWLEQQDNPSPIQLALMFKRLIGAEGWLVVDQCHATQNEAGGWREEAMGELVTALLMKTGWRCLLTSRQPMDLCYNQPLCHVHWVEVPPLGWSERAAMIFSETAAFPGDHIGDNGWFLRLVREGDGYPLQVRLALHELREGEPVVEADGRLRQLVQCLLAMAEPSAVALLQVLASLTFVPVSSQLGGIWRVLGERHGWLSEMYAIHAGQLEALGLVEEVPMDRVWISPAVRELVVESMPLASREGLHRDLALLFFQHGEQILQEAVSLTPLGGEEEGEGANLPRMMQSRASMVMEYAVRHSLRQTDPEFAAAIVQDFLEQQGSGGCRVLVRQRALRLLEMAEQGVRDGGDRVALSSAFGVAGKAFLLVEDHERAQTALHRALQILPGEAPAALTGGLHYELGLLHQLRGEWLAAREAFFLALQIFQTTGHPAAAASVRHGLAHLTARAAKAGTVLE